VSQSAVSLHSELSTDQQQLLTSLASLRNIPVALSTFSGFNKPFVDNTSVSSVRLPKPLSALFDANIAALNPDDLSAVVTDIDSKLI